MKHLNLGEAVGSRERAASCQHKLITKPNQVASAFDTLKTNGVIVKWKLVVVLYFPTSGAFQKIDLQMQLYMKLNLSEITSRKYQISSSPILKLTEFAKTMDNKCSATQINRPSFD